MEIVHTQEISLINEEFRFPLPLGTALTGQDLFPLGAKSISRVVLMLNRYTIENHCWLQLFPIHTRHITLLSCYALEWQRLTSLGSEINISSITEDVRFI